MLVLHHYGPEQAFTAALDQALQAALRTGSAGDVEYYSEYLEPYRFPNENYAPSLRDFLKQKYANQKFDVVIAVIDGAVDFAVRYRDELFPGVPIVYLASKHWPDAAYLTGVWQGPTQKDTLALVLELHPQTKRVFVIDGKLNNDGLAEKTVRGQLQQFETRVEITFLRDLTMDELIAQVKSIPPDSVILYTRQLKATNTTTINAREALARISQISPAPIYCFSDQQIGYGAVGGYVFDTASQAKEMAAIALRVADGTPPQVIPVAEGKHVPMFDWQQMKRWNISENELPVDSDVRFKQLSSWELYRWRIIAALGLLVLEALLIIFLLLQRSRRARAEESRQISEENLRNLSGRLIHLQDEEQRRIAAELHDGLGQSLSIISTRALLCREDISEPESVLEQLGEISAIADSAIDEVRGIAHNLRPFELDRLGLVAAVASMLETVADATSLHVSSDLDQIDSLLSPGAETSVYRIVQEALNNVIKHAAATEARVAIKRDGSGILINIKDNGRGITAKKTSANGNQSGGFGLQGIAERARILAGSYSLNSDTSRGTEIIVRIPLSKELYGKQTADNYCR